jgi:hypothetical protein
LQELKKGDRIMQDQYHPIGEVAGKIYRALEGADEKTLQALQKEIKVSDSALFHQALGWLAREEKICLKNAGKSAKVSLVRQEA